MFHHMSGASSTQPLSLWLTQVTYLTTCNLMWKGFLQAAPKSKHCQRDKKAEDANLLEPVLKSYRVIFKYQSAFYRSKLAIGRGGERDPFPKEEWQRICHQPYLIHHRHIFRYCFSLCLTISCDEELITTREVHLQTALTENFPADKPGPCNLSPSIIRCF